MTEEDDFGRPLPNLSPLFNSPTADLVLSSSDSSHVRRILPLCPRPLTYWPRWYSFVCTVRFYQKLLRSFMLHFRLFPCTVRWTRLRCKVSIPSELHNDAKYWDIDLTEDGETILILLQYVYPLPNPQVSSLASLRLALIAAQRYEITSATGGLRTELVSSKLLEADPLGVYGIACELGLQEDAKIGASTKLYNLSIITDEMNSESRNACI